MRNGGGRRRPADQATLRAWEDQVRDTSFPLLPPYGMEKQALDEWGVTFNRTRDEDRDELQRLFWPWSTACVWVAWQTFDGAADGMAAFRHWRGVIWREGGEGDPDVRPGRLMTLPAAERELRNALEAGKIKATAIRDDAEVPIPAGEWPRLAWEMAEHGEVVEFDRLLMLGAPRYRGVKVPRAAVMQAWPAQDGWAPVEVPAADPPEPADAAQGANDMVEDAPAAGVAPLDVEFREVEEGVPAPGLVLLTPPLSRQERLDAIAREMPAGLRWATGGAKTKADGPKQFPFYRALEIAFGEQISRDAEAWPAWQHYPHRPKGGRPRQSTQK